MAETIAVIAMGEMGSATARRLHERGATVITSLAGPQRRERGAGREGGCDSGFDR